jgi:hypothetical protein
MVFKSALPAPRDRWCPSIEGSIKICAVCRYQREAKPKRWWRHTAQILYTGLESRAKRARIRRPENNHIRSRKII